MFMPGSTGTNKVLGQQSASIETDKLIGNWIPGTGIVNEDSSTGWGNDTPVYWQNQVNGGNHLRVLNMEANDLIANAPNSHRPDAYALTPSGTDEYLGAASTNYGGNPFTMVTERNWAISVWLRSPDSSAITATNGIWSIGASSSQPNLVIDSNENAIYTDQFGTATHYQIKLSGDGEDTFYATIPYELTHRTAEGLAPNWFQLTVISTGTQRLVESGYYPSHKTNMLMLINGTVVWATDRTDIFPGGSSGALSVGASAFGDSTLSSFIGDHWMIGHIHVYAPASSVSTDLPALTVSKTRQNYHAINETYKSTDNHNHYGDTRYAP